MLLQSQKKKNYIKTTRKKFSAFSRICDEAFAKIYILSFVVLTELMLFSRTDADKVVAGKVTLPVYLNATRSHLLFTLDFDTEGEGSGKDHSFYERGVAIISSDLG